MAHITAPLVALAFASQFSVNSKYLHQAQKSGIEISRMARFLDIFNSWAILNQQPE
jgi:hypothetical protein